MIQGIFSKFEKCFNSFLTSILTSTLSKNDKAQISSIFKDSFSSISKAHNLKSGLLRTTYCRKQYYEKELSFNEPVQVSFPVLENENESYHQYVSILETLKQLLKNKNVLNYVLNPYKSNGNKRFFDFTDGNVLKNNDFFVNKVNG